MNAAFSSCRTSVYYVKWKGFGSAKGQSKRISELYSIAGVPRRNLETQPSSARPYVVHVFLIKLTFSSVSVLK